MIRQRDSRIMVMHIDIENSFARIAILCGLLSSLLDRIFFTMGQAYHKPLRLSTLNLQKYAVLRVFLLAVQGADLPARQRSLCADFNIWCDYGLYIRSQPADM